MLTAENAEIAEISKDLRVLCVLLGESACAH
jgi:hypothetical protein